MAKFSLVTYLKFSIDFFLNFLKDFLKTRSSFGCIPIILYKRPINVVIWWTFYCPMIMCQSFSEPMLTVSSPNDFQFHFALFSP